MLVFLALMVAIPVLYAIWLSLTKFHFGSHPVFIGLGNYRAMFADPLFWTGLRLTFELYVMALAMQMIAGVWLGLLLNRLRVMRRVVRTIMLSPFVMPPVVVAMMAIIRICSRGRRTTCCRAWGCRSRGGFLRRRSCCRCSPCWIRGRRRRWWRCWCLADCRSCRRNDQAASLDGASGLRLLRYITLPLLTPTLVTVAVLRSVDLLRVLRPDLHHHAGRAGECLDHAEYLRVPARVRVLRHGVCEHADDRAVGDGADRGRLPGAPAARV